MAKLVMLFFAAAAGVQLIKPLGLPGLTRRRDAWKLAVIGLLAITLIVAFRTLSA